MARSLKLETVISNPGIFWTDNPYTFPHTKFESKDDDVSYAPFHCHIARDSKNYVNNDFTAAHILTGERDAISLGLGKTGSANKFDRLNGWGKLFTATHGPVRKTEDHETSVGTNWDQQSGDCPIMITENMIPHPTGVFLGRKTPDEHHMDGDDTDTATESFWASQARWCSPIGVQFKWSSRTSKPASGAINFSRIALIYMDSWLPGRTLYMPLIDRINEGMDEDSGGGGFGSFVNPASFYRGSNPLDQYYGSNASGDKLSGKYYGEVVAYAQPEILDYMADSFTRAVCVGMYIELLQPKGQGSWYDCGREIFDFKLLFDMPDRNGKMIASNSQIIYPAPYPLRDAIFGESSMKLL